MVFDFVVFVRVIKCSFLDLIHFQFLSGDRFGASTASSSPSSWPTWTIIVLIVIGRFGPY
jgi:hypothetical protein